jgi:hypothetical protein
MPPVRARDPTSSTTLVLGWSIERFVLHLAL